jgi:hypothetical protein
MKATEIKIRKALEPGESYVDPAFLLVETVLGDDGETVTTIEHLATYVVNGRSRWKITTVGQSVPLTHAGALEWAVSFAAANDIPIVYQRDDSSSFRQAAAPSTIAASVSSAAK